MADRVKQAGSDAGARRLPKLSALTDFVEPFRFNDPEQFKALMRETLAHQASDIFVQPGKPVIAKISGRLTAVMNRAIDDSEVKLILRWASERDTALADILSGKAVNARYEVFDPLLKKVSGARVRHGYRVNAVPVLYEGATSAQIVIRAIPAEPPTAAEIGLNDVILRAATPRDGIVYVAGATSSGKTTTFAGIIRHILEEDTLIQGNIVTYEEPIEFRYGDIASSHSIIVQTQVPTQFPNFYDGIREAMRRAPKLISIGELRDEETIRAAVEASLTGHTVFGTVHAINVAAVMRRLISRFPESARATAIYDIVDTARFMLAQRLVRRRDGGMIAAREYLIFDSDIRSQLSRLPDMGRVTSAVQELVDERGHSFKKEAGRLYSEGLIDEHVAEELAA